MSCLAKEEVLLHPICLFTCGSSESSKFLPQPDAQVKDVKKIGRQYEDNVQSFKTEPRC